MICFPCCVLNLVPILVKFHVYDNYGPLLVVLCVFYSQRVVSSLINRLGHTPLLHVRAIF